MATTQPIPMTRLIDALLDQSTRFNPRYLNRLSDLVPEDAAMLAEAWPKVARQRRLALLDDLEEIHMADDLQNFEAVARVALNDEEPGARMQAINILQEYELIDLMPTFIRMAETDADANVRAVAVSALATYVYMGEVDEISVSKLKKVEDCLVRIFSSSETSIVRRKALEALGFSSREEVNGLIEDAYSSADVAWVMTALTAMGRSANPRWKTHVMKMLSHTQPGVRAEAASAAGELEIKKAAPVLIELLDDADLDVRMASIWSLSQIGGAGVRQALENHLEAADDEEAEQIDHALENLDFTEEMRDISLLEIPENEDEDDEPSDDELDADIEDLISEDEQD